MNSIRFLRAGAVIFTIASLAWLIETVAEHNGTTVEISVGALLVTLGAGWLLWEFLGAPLTDDVRWYRRDTTQWGRKNLGDRTGWPMLMHVSALILP